MKHHSYLAVLSAVVLAGLLTAGCTKKRTVFEERRPTDVEATAATQPTVAQSTQAQADRLAEAMAQTQTQAQELAREVIWIDLHAQQQREAQAKRREAALKAMAEAQAQTAAQPTVEEVAAEQTEPVAGAMVGETSVTIEQPTQSPADLLAALRDAQPQAEGSVLAKAVDGSMLSLLEPMAQINAALLEPLDSDQRQLVHQFRDVVNLLRAQVLASSGSLIRVDIAQKLDHMFGEEPIEIRKVELCRQVSGYGIYEPFESETFLAGRDQKLIVYVELDHFQTAEVDSDRYEVKLNQEVMLFNESDGLAVWRHEPVQIVDVSRNRRRDFFVVQLITLPSRLTVGKYRLKVRVTDMHGGSIDETTTQLQVVADETLVKSE